MTRFRPSASFNLLAYAVLALLMAFTPPRAEADNRVDRSVAGRWQLASLLGFADVAALDDREARLLIGTTLELDAQRFKLGKTVCGKSTFEVQHVNRDRDLLENAHVHGTTLGLPARVDVVELSCAYLYLKTPDHAVLAWRGAFFAVKRLKR